MRTGIYGGTFSPVHNGHVVLAGAFIDEMKLDKLLVIPTAIPPHKSEVKGAGTADRLEMLRLAFKNDIKITVSDMEVRRGDKSFTVDTLKELTDMGELYLLCGSDMFLTLETWKDFRELFRLANIVVGRREADSGTLDRVRQYKKYLEDEYGAVIFEIGLEPIVVSSSEIRAAVKEGEDISKQVPAVVEKYISANKLYL